MIPRSPTSLPFAVVAAVMIAAGACCGAVHAAVSATQTLRIETPGCESACCEVSNDKGHWTVESTPGIVTVATSIKPLEVSCIMQGAGSPLGPTRVPSAKGESNASATIVGGIAGAALGIAAIAAAAAVPWALPGAVQLLIPAMQIGAGVGGMADEASRSSSYPETISVPLVCHAQAALESQLAAAPLGIAVRGLTASEIAAAELATAEGAIVTRTAPGGRADRGGVHVGDIVVACNDAGVAGAAELEAMVRSATTGQPVKFRVWRERQSVEIALPAATGRP